MPAVAQCYGSPLRLAYFPIVVRCLLFSSLRGSAAGRTQYKKGPEDRAEEKRRAFEEVFSHAFTFDFNWYEQTNSNVPGILEVSTNDGWIYFLVAMNNHENMARDSWLWR